jgi:hypothetical protein
LNLLNHYKMTETIYIRMKKKGMCLKPFPFIMA